MGKKNDYYSELTTPSAEEKDTQKSIDKWSTKLENSANDIYNYERPEFADPYGERAKTAVDNVVNMKYSDWLTSDDYKALEKRYQYLGNRAMKDTLGQVASRTGGLASSYAGAVSQQSYNDYMTQLEDVARNAYQLERSNSLDNAQLLASMSDTDYSRWANNIGLDLQQMGMGLDATGAVLGQYKNDRDYYFNQRTWAEEFGYGKYGDDYDRALEYSMYTGDFTPMTKLGGGMAWTEKQANKAKKQFQTLELSSNSSGRSGGGRGYRSGGSSGDSYTNKYGQYVTTDAYANKYLDEPSVYQTFLHQGSAKYNNGATVDQVKAWFEDYVMPSNELSDAEKEKLAKALGLLGLSEEEKKGETNYSGKVKAYNY